MSGPIGDARSGDVETLFSQEQKASGQEESSATTSGARQPTSGLAGLSCPPVRTLPDAQPLIPFFSVQTFPARMLRTKTVCVIRSRLGLPLRLFQQSKTPMPRLLFPPQVLQLLLPTATMLMMSSKS
jgi:hypothetical protein